MIKAGIIGATGYAGIELLRLILSHPVFDVTCIVSKSFAKKKISDVYGNLNGICDLILEEPDYEAIAEKADVFFAALPHKASQKAVHTLYEKGKKVVDLSADYRYYNLDTYEKIYNIKHSYPKLNGLVPYGLPELFKDEIKKAVVAANPGCYPTCSILGAAPLLKNKLIDEDSIIINSFSGISGAGRRESLNFSFCESDENAYAYKVASHRHTTEIEEQLGALCNKNIAVSFTPHIVPLKRGMLATIYANLKKDISLKEINNIYKDFYENEFFIRILDEGIYPQIKNISGSNFVDIGTAVDTKNKRVIIVSAIDNIGKGASGQAVQNMNLMCGLDEKTGLDKPGAYL